MKVRPFVYILVFFVVFAFFEKTMSSAEALAGSELLRLHVVANSDSEGDQAVKLAVRDAIRAQVKEVVDQAQSADEAFSALEGTKDALEKTAEETLARHGYAYDAQITLGWFEFPDREYDGTLVPAGRYRAVRIVLGAGEGQNWWCVLYPDLCFVDEACRGSAAEGKTITFYSSVGRWIHDMMNRGGES